MIPEADLPRIQSWVDAKNAGIPEDVRDQVRIDLDVTDRSVTLLESRPPWDPERGKEWISQPVARIRYTRTTGTWALYWADRNSRFHLYELKPPTQYVRHLLHEIDEDPTCIFWG